MADNLVQNKQDNSECQIILMVNDISNKNFKRFDMVLHELELCCQACKTNMFRASMNGSSQDCKLQYKNVACKNGKKYPSVSVPQSIQLMNLLSHYSDETEKEKICMKRKDQDLIIPISFCNFLDSMD